MATASDPEHPLSLFAACRPGLEKLLLVEVSALEGVSAPEAVPGGVTFRGPLAVLYRAHLELGVASHVTVRVTELKVGRLEQLRTRTRGLDWAAYLDPSVPFSVRATARRSRLYHTGAIEERVRRGIDASFGKKTPEPTEDRAGGALTVHARVERDRCTLSVELAGAPLYRRGYRLAAGRAPLREDLARALLRVTRWDGAVPLADPMMGSGTLPIEAALLARRMAPGVGRRFAFEDGSPLLDAPLLHKLRQELRAGARNEAPAPIFGSDRDADAVARARENAGRAGVLGDLRLATAPLSKAPFRAPPLPEAGVLVTNPPFGKRLGKADGLLPLYRALGDLIRTLPPGWHGALVATDRRLARATGIPLETALLTDHGGTKIHVLTWNAKGPDANG